MENQPRTAKVLFSLVVSMTMGALVLLALEKRPLPAGAFSLASYSQLSPIEQSINRRVFSLAGRWRLIEISYSKTAGGNIEQLASLSGLTSPEDINIHFLVCNGRGGNDGQIQPTERWRKQWSCVPSGTWYGNERTIRICVVANGKKTRPTDFQIKRTALLVESLCRQFTIPSKHVYYPAEWQL